MSSLLFWIIVGVLLLFIGLMLYALTDTPTLANHQKRNLHAISTKFGTRLMPHRNQFSIPSGVKKWHKKFRCITTEIRHDSGILIGLKDDLLFKDYEGKYWHAFVTSRASVKEADIVLTSLSELRMRRALFNTPDNYVLAFGEPPKKDQLDASGIRDFDAKLETYDHKLHNNEFSNDFPIGHEFGAYK
jgi:hypothetical protein